MFASESEANDFYKKVANRGKYSKGEPPRTLVRDEMLMSSRHSSVAAAKPAAVFASPASTDKKKKKSKGGKIDKSLISGPVSLVHMLRVFLVLIFLSFVPMILLILPVCRIVPARRSYGLQL